MKWTERELGHLRMILERYQSHSVHDMSKMAHKTIKRRTVNAISHKLREIITEREFKGDTVNLECGIFPAEVISGYIAITLVDGTKRLAHLYVWEYAFGDIPEGYHVHHLNGDRTDNRSVNLQLMSAEDHIALHMAGRPPETAALFWYLQKKGLWEDYLIYREELLTKIPTLE